MRNNTAFDIQVSPTLNCKASLNRVHWLPCTECSARTRHLVLASVTETDASDDGDIQVWTSYEIVQCQGCLQASFRRESGSSEDLDWDPATEELVPVTRSDLFPRRSADRKALREVIHLPNKLRRIYAETHEALCNSQRILAGIGIRALVEAVCSVESANGRTLEIQIDDLVTKGKLTQEGAEILHGTRLLGNKAAHEAASVDKEDLNIAMEVAEHLLKTVYVLPALSKSLPKRQSQLASPASSAPTATAAPTE